MKYPPRLEGSYGVVKRSEGFTLLEILLVIVILATITMMVAPSFVSLSSPSLQDEAKRMVLQLKLAADEAMLSGRPFRLLLREKGYLFESPDFEGEWQAVEGEPYRSYQLPDSVQITTVRPESTHSENGDGDDTEPLIGTVMLLPEGVRTVSEITLTGVEEQLTVQVQSGPGGIRIKEADSE